MSALGDVIDLGWRWKRGNADRILGIPEIKNPDQFEAILLVIENGFVKHDEEVTVRQWQTIVCAAAEGRTPVSMRDQFRRAAIGDVDDNEPGVSQAPYAVLPSTM